MSEVNSPCFLENLVKLRLILQNPFCFYLEKKSGLRWGVNKWSSGICDYLPYLSVFDLHFKAQVRCHLPRVNFPRITLQSQYQHSFPHSSYHTLCILFPFSSAHLYRFLQGNVCILSVASFPVRGTSPRRDCGTELNLISNILLQFHTVSCSLFTILKCLRNEK